MSSGQKLTPTREVAQKIALVDEMSFGPPTLQHFRAGCDDCVWFPGIFTDL
jgi:hypothetical protein